LVLYQFIYSASEKAGLHALRGRFTPQWKAHCTSG